MNRLVEDQMERISIENAKYIYNNVDVIEDEVGNLVSISGNGKYLYNEVGNLVSWSDGAIVNVVLLGEGYQAKIIEYAEEEIETPDYYNNSKGSLYKVATERGWNAYLFDIVKRLERAEKKGEFNSDIDKTINLLKMYKKGC